jgi:hypothetical protein
MSISTYYGVPRNYTQMQATSLKLSKFHIRTALGDLKETYSHNEYSPIHGTGQGSCSSPALWLMISSFLMEILSKNANGMKMVDIMNSTSITQWIEGFVDDMSIFSNTRFNSDTINELKEKLKYDGRYWAGLLEASGGRLELVKSFITF